MEDASDLPLIVGEFIQTVPGGHIYRVDAVTESRARCIRVSLKTMEDEREEGEEDEARGKVINISPNAVVIRVNRIAALKEAAEGYRREKKMSAVPIPVAETSRVEREQNRRAEMAEKRSVKKTNGAGKAVALVGAAKAAKEKAANRAPKAAKTVRDCLCGCGEETTAYFVPGHDARFKSRMVKVERGTMEVKDLPKSVQKAYEFKKRGDGYVTVTNYKGEKHSGYDRHA